jgi:hypothetical protein
VSSAAFPRKKKNKVLGQQKKGFVFLANLFCSASNGLLDLSDCSMHWMIAILSQLF